MERSPEETMNVLADLFLSGEAFDVTIHTAEPFRLRVLMTEFKTGFGLTAVPDGHMTLSVLKAWKPEEKCTCHERDSSYVCDYCKAEGFRGHMEG